MNTPKHPTVRNPYPEALQRAELTALNARRACSGGESQNPIVGMALSGGGIRSATFCLGLFQALARQGLVRRLDYLSTVSGGGYFGGFLGAAFSRPGASVDTVERELAHNHSWPVNWLRENGRFLSPNGAGDTWLSAAVALRNWAALQTVLLTFSFLVLGLGVLIRADLWSGRYTGQTWSVIEQFFWEHAVGGLWWSPWLVLPVIPFAAVMLPTGTLYWLTQFVPLMRLLRRGAGLFSAEMRTMSDDEFAGRAQNALSRGFMLGLIPAVALLVFGVIDSVGQTVYLHWAGNDFAFPSLWALLTSAGAGLFGFGGRIAVYVERLLGTRRFRVPTNIVALAFALLWTLLIVLAVSVAAFGFAWQWDLVWTGSHFQSMSGGWPLMLAVAVCFVASWIFSRAFGFVNLSSLQQVYAARLARAYLGATNLTRRTSENHNMTALIDGDDLPLESYAPHAHGGPLHLINVTVNETISGKTQIERRDRKGLAMSVGPCGLSAGIESHALWVDETLRTSGVSRVKAWWEKRHRSIAPIPCTGAGCFHALYDQSGDTASGGQPATHRIEALPIGRWIAVSGAAFTTGTGANTQLGFSLLLGLANVRLGYWWNSGISASRRRARTHRPNFLELASRLVSRVLPVQACLMNEFFARFHGPARRHWYLSDGGHFENTGCYELLRRRVPFIICSDAGQDPRYDFADFANLVRKARIDFGAEIQVVRRRADVSTDDPGVRFPLPKLEDLVHPNLLDVIGTPDDFPPLQESEGAGDAAPPARFARAHALLARIHYLDTDEFGWLLLVKPGLMGDEAADVLQYQRSHPLFPQEPTSDQYFDEAQWESYRKLGEHVGTELFTPPAHALAAEGASWSPSQMCPPLPLVARAKADTAAHATPEIRELGSRLVPSTLQP